MPLEIGAVTDDENHRLRLPSWRRSVGTMGEWIETETRGMIRGYRDRGLISEAQQTKLMTLVAEGDADVATDLLRSIA
jgi:hypothetical protein